MSTESLIYFPRSKVWLNLSHFYCKLIKSLSCRIWKIKPHPNKIKYFIFSYFAIKWSSLHSMNWFLKKGQNYFWIPSTHIWLRSKYVNCQYKEVIINNSRLQYRITVLWVISVGEDFINVWKKFLISCGWGFSILLTEEGKLLYL